VSIHVLSSMATRQVLGELAVAFESRSGLSVRVESVGGVDAAKRVRAGETFDVVVLASNVIDALIAEGHLAGERIDLVTSAIGIGVRAGSVHPDIGSAAAVQHAVLTAGRIGYSTGPSGDHLLQLWERWGIAETVSQRALQAPPGVPVGSLVAEGEADLGFQQLSELMHVPGIEILGPLPPEIQSVTVFTAGVSSMSLQPEKAQALLAYLTSPQAEAPKRQYGMEPA